MENINLLMKIMSHRNELARVKSVLAGMTIMGVDDASAGAYSAMERAIEKEIAKYELEESSPLTSRKDQALQSRTNATERHKNVLAWIAKYLRVRARAPELANGREYY